MLRPLASYCCPALTVCLHMLLTSFLGCKLFWAEVAWAMMSPLQRAVKEHPPPHGSPLQYLPCLHTVPAHGAGSVLGTHWAHIWLCHPLAGDHSYTKGTDTKCCRGGLRLLWGGGDRWEWELQMPTWALLPGTVAWESRRVWKLPFVHRRVIILNVFRNRNGM